MLNTFEVQAVILSDTQANISDILDSIRAVRSITTVRNITPPEYPQRESAEYTLDIIKFVTRVYAKQNLQQIKNQFVLALVLISNSILHDIFFINILGEYIHKEYN